MRQSKICNCQISTNKDIFKSRCNQSFCDKCGCVLIKDSEGNIYYTLKAKQNRFTCDLSPITIIKNMKKKTEEEYPFIYQEFNVNKDDKFIKDKVLKSINLYLKKRKMLLLKLQKLMKEFDYCDIIFYQTLFYLDTYLSHKITDDFTEKKFLYYLIGFFLCSTKFKESDIYEPSFDAFYDLSRGIYLSIDKIGYYEALCLKEINYNVFSYSVYDWASQLISIGIVFNCEINKDNEIIIINKHRHLLINTINKFIIKMILNLTGKSLFFKYAPMYLAFSLIQISREKYLNKTMIKPKLFSDLVIAYGINPEDYKECYEEVKNEIQKSTNQENDIDEKRNINITQTEMKDELKSDERIDNAKKSSFNSYKNIYVPNNKIKSSNVLIQITDNFLANNSSNKDNNNNETNADNIKEKDLSSKELPNKKYKLKSSKENNISNIRTKQRLSIDCSVNNLKSNAILKYVNLKTNPNPNPSSKDNYSFMTINEEKSETDHSRNFSLNKKGKRPTLKELKHIRPNQHNRYNSISTKHFNTIGNLEEKEGENESNKDKKDLKRKSKFYSNKNIDYSFHNNIEINKNNKLTSKQLPKIKDIEEYTKENNKAKNEEKNRTININKNKGKFKLKTSIKVTLPEGGKK